MLRKKKKLVYQTDEEFLFKVDKILSNKPWLNIKVFKVGEAYQVWSYEYDYNLMSKEKKKYLFSCENLEEAIKKANKLIKTK